MPELIEVERYRLLASKAVGWRVASIEAPDPIVAPEGAGSAGGGRGGGGQLGNALVGQRVAAARRRGKLLLVDTDVGGPTLGIRFGMTGTLLLDGVPALDDLRYAPPPSDDDRWVRFRMRLERGRRSSVLALCDPRRLGRVLLDPDEEALGPDAASIGPAALAVALGTGASTPGSAAPLKARLLDQRRVAGVGNLIADETLWRAGLDPRRPASRLAPAEVRRLHRHLRATIEDLTRRGGSHTGDLMAERRPGGRCPRDAAPLQRAAVGGRTTWWCPAHQR